MIVFDLDLTVWECKDISGKNIWAKQLLPPFSLENETIFDDVGSKCTLKKGVFKYIKWLHDTDHVIGYCSIGAYKNLPFNFQPSIMILKTFSLFDFFKGPSILEYKTYNKVLFLKTIKNKSTFFDDNDKIIENASKLKNLKVIDAKTISNWETLIRFN